MNKHFFYISFFLNISVFAQTEKSVDSITKPYENVVETIENSATDLSKDTLNSALVPVNTEVLNQKKFKPNFQK